MSFLCGNVLNIAAGKIKPIEFLLKQKLAIITNIDPMYDRGNSKISIGGVERETEELERKRSHTTQEIFVSMSAFDFMEKTKLFFDQVCAYRFLEHVSMEYINYFIYLISTCTKPGVKVDIVVPDYEILANMILHEEVIGNPGFEKHNILLTTELLNVKVDPHCSIWTEPRLRYFWELEDRFKVVKIEHEYEFDGRNIYLRMIAERI